MPFNQQELSNLQKQREEKCDGDEHDVYAEMWGDDIHHWRGQIKGPVRADASSSRVVQILFVRKARIHSSRAGWNFVITCLRWVVRTKGASSL